MRNAISDANIRPITVDEFHKMFETGILGQDERIELLDGRLIALPPKSYGHGYATTSLSDLMRARYRDRATVDMAAVLRLSDVSEARPDIVIRRGSNEIVLVVEIAVTTLGFDRGPKMRAYASGGVAEYWIVDIRGDKLVRHREPSGLTYGDVAMLSREDRIAVAAFPDDEIEIDKVFPPIR